MVVVWRVPQTFDRQYHYAYIGLSLSLGVLRDAFDGFDQPPHYACTSPGHTHTPTHLASEPLNAQVSTGSHRLNGADAGLLRRL